MKYDIRNREVKGFEGYLRRKVCDVTSGRAKKTQGMGMWR
jgi:hypothetical protein